MSLLNHTNQEILDLRLRDVIDAQAHKDACHAAFAKLDGDQAMRLDPPSPAERTALAEAKRALDDAELLLKTATGRVTVVEDRLLDTVNGQRIANRAADEREFESEVAGPLNTITANIQRDLDALDADLQCYATVAQLGLKIAARVGVRNLFGLYLSPGEISRAIKQEAWRHSKPYGDKNHLTIPGAEHDRSLDTGKAPHEDPTRVASLTETIANAMAWAAKQIAATPLPPPVTRETLFGPQHEPQAENKPASAERLPADQASPASDQRAAGTPARALTDADEVMPPGPTKHWQVVAAEQAAELRARMEKLGPINLGAQHLQERRKDGV